MFIFVVYKDAPELSRSRRRSSASEGDMAVEKTLLVNPDCHVRVMLEYIRKKCRLGMFTQFDICDDSGRLKCLFELPTYAKATNLFEHKKTYYIIVLRNENDSQGRILVPISNGRVSILPQLNHDNQIYEKLVTAVNQFLLTGGVSPVSLTPPSVGKQKSIKSKSKSK